MKSATRRTTATTVAGVVVLGLVALFVDVGLGRFTATTSAGAEAVAAGTVDVEMLSSGPLLSGEDLERGSTATGCVELEYAGSVVPAEVRLYLAQRSGRPLRGVDVAVTVADSCWADEANARPIFAGSLGELWLARDWESGLTVWTATSPGERVAVRAVAVLGDDASGGAVSFAAVWEARDVGGTAQVGD